MYYIYDNDNEEWYSVAFVDFEMAEEEMGRLILKLEGIEI